VIKKLIALIALVVAIGFSYLVAYGSHAQSTHSVRFAFSCGLVLLGCVAAAIAFAYLTERK
jgi:hypothetical protein